jgi:hypothetical protein
MKKTEESRDRVIGRGRPIPCRMRVDEAVPSVYVVPGLEASEAQKWRKLPEWSNLAKLHGPFIILESVWLEVSVNFVSLVNDGRVDFKLKLSETYPT